MTTPKKKAPARKAPAPNTDTRSKQVRPRATTVADPKPQLAASDPANQRTHPDPIVARAAGPSMTDRIARWLPLVGVLLTLVIIPSILNASDNTDAQIRSDTITGCRSEANSLVADATTNFHLARNHRDNLIADLNILQNEQITTALAAIGERDGSGVQAYGEIVAQLEPKRAEIRTAQVEVGRAETSLSGATNAYVEAVALSRSDPDRFVAECRETR